MTDALKVLLIDDSEITREVVKQLLIDAGFDVRAVGSLRGFLNALLDWHPHVIVTDLHMPEMSGAELCTWLRQHVEVSRTPIVLYSSTPSAELAEIAKSVNADAYLSKEDGIGELPRKLKELCDAIVW